MENSNRKPGDIEMIFGNPIKSKDKCGLARLDTYIGNTSENIEQWLVEYLNQEGHYYEAFLKKKNNGESK